MSSRFAFCAWKSAKNVLVFSSAKDAGKGFTFMNQCVLKSVLHPSIIPCRLSKERTSPHASSVVLSAGHVFTPRTTASPAITIATCTLKLGSAFSQLVHKELT